MLYLSFCDQVSHGSRHILDGHLGIYPVLIENIDDIGLQPFKRRLGNAADMFRPAVDPLPARGTVLLQAETEFRRDDKLVIHSLEGFSQQFLVGIRAVQFGSIKEGNTPVYSSVENLDHILRSTDGFFCECHTHASEPQRRYFQLFVS